MQFDIEERFGQELRKALVRRFGKVPSAAFVAIRFNQLETLEKTVSGECVRRWIRGAAMPSYDHLSLLASWLSIDLDDTIKRQTGRPPASHMGAFDRFFSRLASDMQHQMGQLCGSCSTFDVRLSLDRQEKAGGGGLHLLDASRARVMTAAVVKINTLKRTPNITPNITLNNTPNR